jgi:hypothetical protein
MASPWKALTDYVYVYKKDWRNVPSLVEDLRLDIDSLTALDQELAEKLSNYYYHQRIVRFLKIMMRFYQNEYRNFSINTR